MDEEKKLLTYEQAIAMLPDGESIHTLRNFYSGLIESDWDREKLLDAIKTGQPQIGGYMSRKIGHGLVIFTGEEQLFIETKKNAPEEFEKNAPEEIISQEGLCKECGTPLEIKTVYCPKCKQ